MSTSKKNHVLNMICDISTIFQGNQCIGDNNSLFKPRAHIKLPKMASSSSVVWVCSRIGGLTKNLNKLLPSVQFVQVTEDKLKNMESSLDGKNNNHKPQVLIADNAIIPRLMYVGSVPFKFIQVNRKSTITTILLKNYMMKSMSLHSIL